MVKPLRENGCTPSESAFPLCEAIRWKQIAKTHFVAAFSIKLSRRKRGVRPDSFQLVIFGLLGMIQIPTQLKIHPEVCRHPKELRQPQSRAWRDAPSQGSILSGSVVLLRSRRMRFWRVPRILRLRSANNTRNSAQDACLIKAVRSYQLFRSSPDGYATRYISPRFIVALDMPEHLPLPG
jgi:hypothetical protein